MWIRITEFAALALVLGLTDAAAAQKPDFSGKWATLSADGERLEIIHKDQAISIVSETDRVRNVVRHSCDGSRSKHFTDAVNGARWSNVSECRWVGNALLIVTTTTRENGARWDWMAVYTLQPETGHLVRATFDYVLTGGPYTAIGTKTFAKRGAAIPDRVRQD